MKATQTEAEAEIDAAIAAAVEATFSDVDLRRTITQYLTGAHKDLPPEERTSSVIDMILATLGDEGR